MIIFENPDTVHVVATFKTGLKLDALDQLARGLRQAYGDHLQLDSDGPGQIRILSHGLPTPTPLVTTTPTTGQPATPTTLLAPRPIRDQPQA